MLHIARARSQALNGQAREARIAAHVSQVDVGRALGVSGVTVHRWETGVSLPSGDVAVRWINLLDQLRTVAP